MHKTGIVSFFQRLSVLLLMTPAAFASQPKQWQMGLQEAATPTMEHIVHMHNDIMLPILFGIAAFVITLTAFILWRFRASKNPNPSKKSHNVPLEIVWTIMPAIILLFIAFPSLELIRFADKVVDPEMTVKVTGHMWYWKYEYPDDEITFDSNIIMDKDLKPGQLRLLDVDNQMVVPVDTNVRILFTAADVLHSWAVPAFGVKKDCVPGRLNESWIRVKKPGVYYGQCSELCGMKHGFMPIAVRAVSKEEYQAWLKHAKKEFSE